MIHRTKDLSRDERTVLEGLLGRSISDEDYVSTRTKPDASAPEWLRASWASAIESRLDRLSMHGIDAEVDAVRRQRHAQKISETPDSHYFDEGFVGIRRASKRD